MTFYADDSILAKIPGDLIALGGRHRRRQGLSSLRRGPCLSDGNGYVCTCPPHALTRAFEPARRFAPPSSARTRLGRTGAAGSCTPAIGSSARTSAGARSAASNSRCAATMKSPRSPMSGTARRQAISP